jgi:phosphoribosylaminoimidazolecarboxamide formyltransferase/IMP cyclohydrolase
VVSTGGSAATIESSGCAVTRVDEVTGYPEMLDGRVKTLHPAVHAGILAMRDKTSHMEALEKHSIGEINLVVVNLYPFR